MPQTVTVKITVDLKYINWSTSTTPTGQLQWDVDPTLLVVPNDDCTIQFKLEDKNANGATVIYATTNPDGAEGIVWKNTASNPGTPTRTNDNLYEVDFNNSNATSSTDWGYTVNIKVSRGTFSKVLSYDPDVENESPANL